ncbi:MAG: polymerase, sigma-24 subunit, subfamily [Verrucomicrobiales bacterium]|nr:polymerase, sigma-24 subunit, subfamily [Verrucomicrobiales bacterium]
MQELDDIALLREYVELGSEDAFAVLVARHINKVYSVALRHTGNPHQAQEITQVVFVILARKARSLGKRVILEGWLYQTARLTALASVRSELRRAHREQEAYMQSVSNETESDPWPQIAPLLDTAIASLNETDRHAVVLRFIYGKSTKEVGAVLGVNEGATRLRLHRAMEKLRRFFDKRGIISTSETLAGAITAHAVQSAPLGLTKIATALALAKAPVVSGTILTLTKGTLKMIAWTKVKTAVVAGAVVLLATATTSVIIKEIRHRANTHRSPVPLKTAASGSVRGQLFGQGQLINAGNTTPEDAWESRYWARAQGDYDAVLAGNTPQGDNTAKEWMGDRSTYRARSQKEFTTTFQGFQILARKDLPDGRVELKYRFTSQDNTDTTTPPSKIVTMIQLNSAWLCDGTRASDEGWDAGSQPEPESAL